MRARLFALAATGIVVGCGGSDHSKKVRRDDASADAALEGASNMPPAGEDAGPSAPDAARGLDASVDVEMDSSPEGGRVETDAAPPPVDGGAGLVCLDPPGPVTLSLDCMDYFAPGTYFDFATNVFHLDAGIFDPEELVVHIATVESIGARPHRLGDPEFSIDGNVVSVQVPPAETMRYAYIEVFDVIDPDTGRPYHADNLVLRWGYENSDAGAGERTCSTFAPLTIVPVPFDDCLDLIDGATTHDASSTTLTFMSKAPYATQVNATAYGIVGTTYCPLSNGVEAVPGRTEWDTSPCPGATEFEVGIIGVRRGQQPSFVLRVNARVPADGLDAAPPTITCELQDESLFTPLPVETCDDALSFATYDDDARTFSWSVASGLQPTEVTVTTDLDDEVTLDDGTLQNGSFVWDLSDVVSPEATRVDFKFVSAVDGCGLGFMSDMRLSYTPGDGAAWSGGCSTGGNCYPACAERCGCEG